MITENKKRYRVIIPESKFDDFFEIIATEKKGVRSVCKEIGVSITTIMGRIADDTDLQVRYARAKNMQAEMIVSEIAEIAENATNDNFQATRIKIDTAKFIAVKLLRKMYGEKMEVELSGEVVTEIKRTVISKKV